MTSLIWRKFRTNQAMWKRKVNGFWLPRLCAVNRQLVFRFYSDVHLDIDFFLADTVVNFGPHLPETVRYFGQMFAA